MQDTAVGKSRIELAGLAVDRKKRTGLAAEQQPLGIALLPVAEAAIDEEIEAERPVELRVEFPQLASRHGVKG